MEWIDKPLARYVDRWKIKGQLYPARFQVQCQWKVGQLFFVLNYLQGGGSGFYEVYAVGDTKTLYTTASINLEFQDKDERRSGHR
jgi:hypothetical protein